MILRREHPLLLYLLHTLHILYILYILPSMHILHMLHILILPLKRKTNGRNRTRPLLMRTGIQILPGRHRHLLGELRRNQHRRRRPPLPIYIRGHYPIAEDGLFGGTLGLRLGLAWELLGGVLTEARLRDGVLLVHGGQGLVLAVVEFGGVGCNDIVGGGLGWVAGVARVCCARLLLRGEDLSLLVVLGRLGLVGLWVLHHVHIPLLV